MSAPHTITFDVYFKGRLIDTFDLDADLDLPTDIFDELKREFSRKWFDAKVLFRLSEHIYYVGKSDFMLEDHWFSGEHGDLRLTVTDVKDWG